MNESTEQIERILNIIDKMKQLDFSEKIKPDSGHPGINAIATRHDGKLILLTSSIVNDKVSISIKDNGIGIPEADQNKLFTLFFRAANAEHIQGTGLGLSIVKNYLELINGKIEFISKSGEGTTFIIEFPKIGNTYLKN